MPLVSVASFLGIRGIRRIASDISSVCRFPSTRFIRLASRGIERLSLFERANHIALVLDDVLAAPFPKAVRLLVEASGPPRNDPGYGPMENFRLLAFTRLISLKGRSHFFESMVGLKQLTRRFTSEFDIRPFLIESEAATLATLQKWIEDEDFHVRRLVSESTRSRLPWGVHIKAFQKDPSKVISIIECLNNDPVRYVQKSVANNLADIIKDNPEYGFSVAEHWTASGRVVTRKIVHHALRFPARQGSARARLLRED